MGCDKCQMEICFCPEVKEGEPRMKLVEHIKQQIAKGTYLTEEKLAIAMARFLEKLK